MVTTRVGSGSGIGFHPPPLKFPVDVRVTENDPGLGIKVTDRTVSIKGTATNNGTVASFAQFEVAGKKVNINLSRGMTGEKVLAELKKRLPDGYSIQGNADSFKVMRGGPTRPSTVAQIDAIFAAARDTGSPGRGLITTAELRAAFKVGLSTAGKLSADEKLAIAKNWAGTFTGAGFLATPAAQKEYARLQKKFALPALPVF